MKKILTVILVVGAIYGACYYEHNYTRKECEVIQVNDGVVTVEDSCGFVWDFKGNELKVGDIVDLKMYDNSTSTYINDDIVKDVVLRTREMA